MPIIAVAPGIVEKVVNSVGSPRGKYVQIKHQTSTGQTMHVIYQHNMKNNPLSVGDTVKQGQTIAWVGGSGASENSYSPHLHFEVSPTGNRNDAVKRYRKLYKQTSKAYLISLYPIKSSVAFALR